MLPFSPVLTAAAAYRPYSRGRRTTVCQINQLQYQTDAIPAKMRQGQRGRKMRASITVLFLLLAPAVAYAQPNSITITTACTNPPAQTEVPPPVSPSIAAGTVAARN